MFHMQCFGQLLNKICFVDSQAKRNGKVFFQNLIFPDTSPEQIFNTFYTNFPSNSSCNAIQYFHLNSIIHCFLLFDCHWQCEAQVLVYIHVHVFMHSSSSGGTQGDRIKCRMMVLWRFKPELPVLSRNPLVVRIFFKHRKPAVRVDQPITNCLPMPKYLFISSSYVLCFD